MIESVRIRNFKNIRDQDIDLERLTVFVGANGCGKTSVLEAIHNAVRAATGDPLKVFSHERHGDWVYTRGGLGDLSITCVTGGGEFTVHATPPVGFPPHQDLLQKSQWEFRVSPEKSEIESSLSHARALVFLHLDAAELANPSYSEHDPPRMKFNGEGLASVLAYMALNDPDAFQRLVEDARRLIPRLQRIRFRKSLVHRTETEVVRFGNDAVERQSVRAYQGEMILLDFENAENISARTASEGTLLFLGLLTMLHGPIRPRILLMDDIEHGLHPLAQKTLLATLRRVMEDFPNLQVLGTAHSPLLLDQLQAKEVRLMTVGFYGCTICGKLTDHPQFARWKEEMAPGEMWSVFGEKWLAERGGRR